MSIRTNSQKAVPVVLKRLNLVRRHTGIDEKQEKVKKLGELKSQLDEIKELFALVKKLQLGFLDQLTDLDVNLRKVLSNVEDFENIESRVHLTKADINKSVIKYLKEIFDEVLPRESDTNGGKKSSDEEVKGPDQKHRQLALEHDTDSMKKVLQNFQVSYDKLRLELRLCLPSLTIFPEKAVLKKRPLIYWWIGEGLVKKTNQKTAEEVGESIFEELLDCDMIIPFGNGKCPVVNKYQIHPWIRLMLLESILGKDYPVFGFYSKLPSASVTSSKLPSEGVTSSKLPSESVTSSKLPRCLVLDVKRVNISADGNPPQFADLRTIFNVDAIYLSFKFLDQLKKLVVLQLGRWQNSSEHHIEVASEDFLKDLKTQKHLKYLSLRGISRITELPHTIVELGSLEILDLKACHNLETLPHDIASLKNLTHLDVSECYLLERMPKGIEKLASLQVLKGFVIGDSKKTPCRIAELTKLKKLKRLGIHIGSEAVIQDGEFEKLKDIISVERLKISWGVLSGNEKDKALKEKVLKQNFSFPPTLKKLDLEGFPGESVPDWLKPSKLEIRGLKKLYIRGGMLKSLDHPETEGKWNVEILRLKYLRNLETELSNLKKLFPNLKYVQKEGGRDPFEWSHGDSVET